MSCVVCIWCGFLVLCSGVLRCAGCETFGVFCRVSGVSCLWQGAWCTVCVECHMFVICRVRVVWFSSVVQWCAVVCKVCDFTSVLWCVCCACGGVHVVLYVWRVVCVFCGMHMVWLSCVLQ